MIHRRSTFRQFFIFKNLKLTLSISLPYEFFLQLHSTLLSRKQGNFDFPIKLSIVECSKILNHSCTSPRREIVSFEDRTIRREDKSWIITFTFNNNTVTIVARSDQRLSGVRKRSTTLKLPVHFFVLLSFVFYFFSSFLRVV